MKKGVFDKFIYIGIILLVVLSLSVSAIGPGEETTGPRRGSSLLTEYAGGPAVPGYWVPICRGAECGHRFPWDSRLLNLTDDTSRNCLPGGGACSWTLGLSEIYDKSGIDVGSLSPNEIDTLLFVLDPLVFSQQISGVDTLFSSHGLPLGDATEFSAPFPSFEGGCIECASVDVLDECSAPDPEDPFKLYNSCFELNILNRDDCSEFADLKQPFCEGVGGVAPNTDSSVGSPGVAGLGGCRLYGSESTDMNAARNYGRDWYDDAGHDSPDFLVSTEEKARIGSCCGNDPEDVGAISANSEFFGSYPDQYLCYNDSSSSPNNMRWMDAQGSSLLFKILSFNRQGKEFDVVSNSNNWIACNTGDKSLYGLYKNATKAADDKWTGGILVDEYEGIPEPKSLVAENTEILGGGGGGGSDGSLDPDTGRGSSASEDVIIDEESFSTEDYDVHGAAATTLCDKDGDGYDGEWSADPASPFHDTSSPACTSPQPPFDCDEGNLGDDLYPESYRTTEGKALFARMRHPGRMDYCVDGVDYDLDCDFSNDFCIADPTAGEATPESVIANPEAKLLAPRFICSNVDNKGEFSECCGWDKSFCFNPAKGRREGSALHTLREFDSYTGTPLNPELLNKTNFVLRYGVGIPGTEISEGATFRLALFTNYNDLGIKDWQHYKNLEFYIWFTANYEVDLWVGKFSNRSGYVFTELDQYIFPVKLKITDYVVNEPGLRKWLHVVIPIEDIFALDFTPGVIVFASDAAKVKALGTIVEVPGISTSFSNVVGIDKIFLTPKDVDLPAGAENFYCSGTWPPSWVKDLDQSTPPNKYTDQPAGRDACEAIPSYGWTGSKCCGDDTGEDTAPGTIGAETFKELYADTKAGCWMGNVLANNSRAMIVQYSVSSGGRTVQMERTCMNSSCVYELPPAENVLVTNPNPDIYDLAFANGAHRVIGVAGLTTNNHTYLLAEDVPMQVLYMDGEYWGCDAARFITSKLDDDRQPLIPVANRVVSQGESCAVKGNYFCDHIDGANSGWKGEGLIRYPDSNITKSDGTELELGPGSFAGAEYRTSAKHNYNLIMNGGFENV